ncbi:hypothetical protein NC3_32010 [Bacillus altitudinis]|uniref:Uncharacterized protein n=1 Tax=Bacillus aerius TaxID=293388 RepID=A0ABR6AY61_9BACI|nr:hypothetical protein [Bacillus aerius]BDC60241.1 hypothetical protein NC3_32010 [Bacillus altitudinis]
MKFKLGTLGDINQFLKKDIYSTKTVHFSGEKRLKYHFIVTMEKKKKLMYHHTNSKKLTKVNIGDYEK